MNGPHYQMYSEIGASVSLFSPAHFMGIKESPKKQEGVN